MTLSSSLRELEELGIVSRTQCDEMPVRVELALTDVGRSHVPIMVAKRDWSVEYARKLTVAH